MSGDRSRDILIRTRFLTICFAIMGAFWGMAKVSEYRGQPQALVWTYPDADAAITLMNMHLSWDHEIDDPPAGE